jgi:hypothetical protein
MAVWLELEEGRVALLRPGGRTAVWLGRREPGEEALQALERSGVGAVVVARRRPREVGEAVRLLDRCGATVAVVASSSLAGLALKLAAAGIRVIVPVLEQRVEAEDGEPVARPRLAALVDLTAALKTPSPPSS